MHLYITKNEETHFCFLLCLRGKLASGLDLVFRTTVTLAGSPERMRYTEGQKEVFFLLLDFYIVGIKKKTSNVYF